MIKPKIFPTITTLGNGHLKKLKETENLGLEEICVFFTGLKKEQRKDFYKQIEKSSIKKIPFAHIRDDFDKNELYYLRNNFGTKIFNTHSSNEHAIEHDFEELKKDICMENTLTEFTSEDIDDYGGLCLDISHLENDRLSKNKRYTYFSNLLKKVSCRCGHISAVKKTRNHCTVAESERFDSHFFDNLSDFDYLKKYQKLLPPIIALEVQNSIKSQLQAIKYINSILKI